EDLRILDPYQVAAKAPSPRVLLEAGDELTVAAAVGYRPLSWLGVAAELAWLEPLVAAVKDRTVDIQGGFQFFPTARLQLFVGAGSNVPQTSGRHELFRVFAGIGGQLFAPRSSEAARPSLPTPIGGDRDGDGVPDVSDLCPDEPEDRDGFEDEDG